MLREGSLLPRRGFIRWGWWGRRGRFLGGLHVRAGGLGIGPAERERVWRALEVRDRAVWVLTDRRGLGRLQGLLHLGLRLLDRLFALGHGLFDRLGLFLLG